MEFKDWFPALIGLISALIVALFSYFGLRKQIKTTLQTSTEQIKTSLEIAKLNLKGRIIWEQHQKWLYEVTIDISELLSKLQSIQDIIKTVSENKDTDNQNVQEIISQQIYKYWDLTERVQFLTDKISLQLDAEKEHHIALNDSLFSVTKEAVTVDFLNLNSALVKELNTSCFLTAKHFIKTEKEELKDAL